MNGSAGAAAPFFKIGSVPLSYGDPAEPSIVFGGRVFRLATTHSTAGSCLLQSRSIRAAEVAARAGRKEEELHKNPDTTPFTNAYARRFEISRERTCRASCWFFAFRSQGWI